MCQKCYEAVMEFFPLDPDGEGMSVLWNETCFPFGDGAQEYEQMREARFKRDNYLLEESTREDR